MAEAPFIAILVALSGLRAEFARTCDWAIGDEAEVAARPGGRLMVNASIESCPTVD